MTMPQVQPTSLRILASEEERRASVVGRLYVSSVQSTGNLRTIMLGARVWAAVKENGIYRVCMGDQPCVADVWGWSSPEEVNVGSDPVALLRFGENPLLDARIELMGAYLEAVDPSQLRVPLRFSEAEIAEVLSSSARNSVNITYGPRSNRRTVYRSGQSRLGLERMVESGDFSFGSPILKCYESRRERNIALE